MRRIVVSEFITLDGVIQAPGGPDEDRSGGFAHGGWLVPHSDETSGAAVDEILAAPFDLLLGRRTYDIFAAHWPYAEANAAPEEGDRTIARKFNAAAKYVATHAPDTLTWQHSEALGPDIVTRLHELKRADGPALLVYGSGVLVRTLLANDLIDTLHLFIFPIMLGKGKRLFDDGAVPAAFRLAKTVASAKGVVIASYERAGEVTTGSFALATPSEAEIARRARNA